MSTLTLPSDVADARPADLRVTRMRSIWQRLLNQHEFSDDSEFFDLGGTSVLVIGMLEIIREEFDREIALDDLADGISIRRLIQLLG
jgi:acyl carrier protein